MKVRTMKTCLGTSVGVCCMWVAAIASAANRTWDGGGSDANWRTPANWDGNVTCPSMGDALFFGGLAWLSNVNDFSTGTAFSGLTFNAGAGAFTLAGNAITLDGDISNLSANAQTIDLPLILSDVRTVYGVDKQVTLNGTLSGPGGLTAAITNGTLKLTGDNTYEGFTTIADKCRVEITHGNALGSLLAGTLVDGDALGILRFSGSVEIEEPITLKSVLPGYAPSLISGSGTNVLKGLISKRKETRLQVESGANTLVLAGGLKHIADGGACVFYTDPGATLVVTNKPIELGGNYALVTERSGTAVFAVAGNTMSYLEPRSGSRVRMEVAHAFTSDMTLKLSSSWATGNAIFDMNGFDQTVGSLEANPNATKPAYLAVTSALPTTLTVNQGTAKMFPAALAGAVSLVKNGAASLTFTDVVSPTTGDIIVNAGTLAVAETGGFSATKRVWVNGGTLELRNGTSLPDDVVLAVAAGAKVNIKAGVSETIGKLYLGGEPQVSGTWGATGSGATHENDDFFSGGGVVNVMAGPTGPTAALWDGGGDDLAISTAANWVGDVLPSNDGYTTATFAAGGTTAIVDTAFTFNRMVFNADTDFTLAAGAGVITNGLNGLVAMTPNVTPRTYTIDEDIVFANHQHWRISNNGTAVVTLDVTGTLSDNDAPCDLVFQGEGMLRLSGNNTYRGKTTVVSTGVVEITHGNALGSADGATEIRNGGYLCIEGGSGITVAEPFIIGGEGILTGCGWHGAIRNVTGSNVLTGKITAHGGRIRALAGSPLELTGGADGSALVYTAVENAWIRISGKPVSTTRVTCHVGGGGVIFAVAGNTISEMFTGGHFVRFDVPNAFLPTMSLQQGSAGGQDSYVDLNGHDQVIGTFSTGTVSGYTRILFSVEPATLTINQNADRVHSGNITGAVSIVKLGTGSLLFTGAHTTSGSFSVSNGVLAVGDTGTFGNNSTNIAVGGSGTLLLSNSVAIADAVIVQMPPQGVGTAKIQMADGVDERVGWLYYGDKMQRAGTYGSSDSSAYYKDNTRFAGKGVLRVLHDDAGTLFLLR